MNKRALFKLYKEIYSADAGGIECGNCNQCEIDEESVVLFPFEEEFLASVLGEEQRTWTLVCKSGTLKTLNIPTVPCKFFAGNKCTVYNARPVSCRIYPFNPNLDGNKLNLYIDMTCPKANEVLRDKKFTQQMIEICKKIAEKVDLGFWKSWSSMPTPLDNLTRNHKFICLLREF